MSDLKNEPNDIADKAKNFVGRLYRKSREVGSEIIQTARLKKEIVDLESRREEVFIEMGKKVWALYGKGLVKNADLLSFCRDIESIDSEVRAKENEIEEIRARRPQEEADVEEEEAGIESEPEVPSEPAPEPGSPEKPAEPKRPDAPEKPVIPIELDETPGDSQK